MAKDQPGASWPSYRESLQPLDPDREMMERLRELARQRRAAEVSGQQPPVAPEPIGVTPTPPGAGEYLKPSKSEIMEMARNRLGMTPEHPEVISGARAHPLLEAKPEVVAEEPPPQVVEEPPVKEEEPQAAPPAPAPAPEPQKEEVVPATHRLVDGVDMGDLKVGKEIGDTPKGGEFRAPRPNGGFHGGVDVILGEGTGIRAVTGLVVTEVGEKFDPVAHHPSKKTGSQSVYNGNFIRLKDKAGYTHTYIHLKDKPQYNVGDTLSPGDIIGLVGGTGFKKRGSEWLNHSTHMHIQVRNPNRDLVNPVDYLRVLGDVSGAATGESPTAYRANMTPLEVSHDRAKEAADELESHRQNYMGSRAKLQEATRELAKERELELEAREEAHRVQNLEDAKRAATEIEGIRTNYIAKANEQINKATEALDELAKRRKGNPWMLFGFTDSEGNPHKGKAAFTVLSAIALVSNAWATMATHKKKRSVPFLASNLISMAINTDLNAQMSMVRSVGAEARGRSDAASEMIKTGASDIEARIAIRNAHLKASQEEINNAKSRLGLGALVVEKLMTESHVEPGKIKVGEEGRTYEEPKLENLNDALDLLGSLVNMKISQENHDDMAKMLEKEEKVSERERITATKLAELEDNKAARAATLARIKAGQGPKGAKEKTANEKRLSADQKDAFSLSMEVFSNFSELKGIMRDLENSGIMTKFAAESLAMWDMQEDDKGNINSWIARLGKMYSESGVPLTGPSAKMRRAIEIRMLIGALLKRLVESGNLNKEESLEGKRKVPIFGDPKVVIQQLGEIENTILTGLLINYAGGTTEDRRRYRVAVNSLTRNAKGGHNAKAAKAIQNSMKTWDETIRDEDRYYTLLEDWTARRERALLNFPTPAERAKSNEMLNQIREFERTGKFEKSIKKARARENLKKIGANYAIPDGPD